MMRVQNDPWLTALFQKPVFRVEVDGQESLKLPSVCFAYAKVGAENIQEAKALTDSGFFIADTNISFACETSNLRTTENQAITVRLAKPEDDASVRRIAGSSFSFTRFHADPFVDNGLADKIKEEWAGNFFSGMRGDEMLVAEKDGKVIGFCQNLIQGNKVIIDLIAVDRNAQGQGAGGAMISNLRGRYTRVHVGTQLANKKSIALYEKAGFRFHGAHYVLHKHNT